MPLNEKRPRLLRVDGQNLIHKVYLSIVYAFGGATLPEMSLLLRLSPLLLP